MAEVRVEGWQVSIHLSLAEKIGALHGDLHFPRSAILIVRVVDKPFREIEGIRSPGTGIPGVIALGTYWRARGRRDFVAVYRGERGVVVEIDADQTKYRRVILSTKDPDGVRNLLVAGSAL
jgi:hypothetical protein